MNSVGRTGRRRWTWLTIGFAIGILVGATSAVQLAPRLKTDQTIFTSTNTPGQDGDSHVSGAGNTIDNGGAGVATQTAKAAGLECVRGRNGGITDIGVTGSRISLKTTVVQSGIGAAFLGEVRIAMEAIKNKVNRKGGVCGRLLDIKYVDDGWDSSRGSNYIKNFIQEGVFAIPVAPSSEGLRLAIDSGAIARAGVPVVGTDGMLADQYHDPAGLNRHAWVWPVAVSTASSARIMAQNAYERGARKFSIVFDKNYRFGVEAAQAYENEVRRLLKRKPGEVGVAGYNKDNACDKSFCGILAGQSTYAPEVNKFDRGDFVAMFLEPRTALTWMSTAKAPRPSNTTYGIGGAQPLFTREFGNNCQEACHGMRIWTGYRPPIESYANESAVRTYVNDLRRTKPDADEFNAFSEGGYVGMVLLVEALQKVSPLLTRARLRAALDSMTLQSGLTIQDGTTWSRGNHFANTTMRAFAIQYKGTFSGWRALEIEQDPHPTFGTR